MEWKSSKTLIYLVIIALICIFVISILSSLQEPDAQRHVVVYTSVDQIFSEPIIKKFEDTTGIKVDAVYDVEATKTTGLVQRLIAEKNNPLADVFWNGEFAHTIRLKEEGVLQPYSSPSAEGLPELFHDPDEYWTAFGGRARILLINTDQINESQAPDSIFDLLDPAYPAETIGISHPVFGTSATHAAALYSLLGQEKARSFYRSLQERGVIVADGNSVVRDLVASGQLAIGLTDSDDALGAIKRGAPVRIIIPDQEDGAIGTLVMPNTVAMIKGSNNVDEAKAFIDFLLSEETEADLTDIGWFQAPTRISPPEELEMSATSIKQMNVTLPDIYDELSTSQEEMRTIFIR